MSHMFYKLLPPFLKVKCRKVDRVILKGATKPIVLYTYDLNPIEWGDHVSDDNFPGVASEPTITTKRNLQNDFETEAEEDETAALSSYRMPEIETSDEEIEEVETEKDAKGKEESDNFIVAPKTRHRTGSWNPTPQANKKLPRNKALQRTRRIDSVGTVDDAQARKKNQQKVTELRQKFGLGTANEDGDDKDVEIVDDASFNRAFSQAVDSYILGDWMKALKRLTRCLNIRRNDGPATVLLEYIGKTNYVAPDRWNGYRKLHEK
eukprot:TRINITY_DN5880_c1_g3_i2.p1 TRINITY_DN5880_c1_g3~~TRINITY_DN5880_c1_g3_i2.p1  ORF type:complete len:264 (+),score=83.56 TRINITY_DN5880_c1_g3_i2:172-963(+)